MLHASCMRYRMLEASRAHKHFVMQHLVGLLEHVYLLDTMALAACPCAGRRRPAPPRYRASRPPLPIQSDRTQTRSIFYICDHANPALSRHQPTSFSAGLEDVMRPRGGGACTRPRCLVPEGRPCVWPPTVEASQLAHQWRPAPGARDPMTDDACIEANGRTETSSELPPQRCPSCIRTTDSIS